MIIHIQVFYVFMCRVQSCAVICLRKKSEVYTLELQRRSRDEAGAAIASHGKSWQVMATWKNYRIPSYY